MVQIRNVPAELHRKLKARAALAGMSLSDYLLAEIRELAARPTAAEVLERIASRPTADPAVPPAAAVRALRED
jgi:plasmid stability protein